MPHLLLISPDNYFPQCAAALQHLGGFFSVIKLPKSQTIFNILAVSSNLGFKRLPQARHVWSLSAVHENSGSMEQQQDHLCYGQLKDQVFLVTDYQVLLSLMEELVQAFVADAIWHPGIALMDIAIYSCYSAWLSQLYKIKNRSKLLWFTWE